MGLFNDILEAMTSSINNEKAKTYWGNNNISVESIELDDFLNNLFDNVNDEDAFKEWAKNKMGLKDPEEESDD